MTNQVEYCVVMVRHPTGDCPRPTLDQPAEQLQIVGVSATLAEAREHVRRFDLAYYNRGAAPPYVEIYERDRQPRPPTGHRYRKSKRPSLRPLSTERTEIVTIPANVQALLDTVSSDVDATAQANAGLAQANNQLAADTAATNATLTADTDAVAAAQATVTAAQAQETTDTNALIAAIMAWENPAQEAWDDVKGQLDEIAAKAPKRVPSKKKK